MILHILRKNVYNVYILLLTRRLHTFVYIVCILCIYVGVQVKITIYLIEKILKYYNFAFLALY